MTFFAKEYPLLTNATELRYHAAMNTSAIFEIIKQKGLRLTKTRRAVLELFAATHTPLSVPRILTELDCSGISVNKTTVYRELETLETVGIVKSLSLGDRKQYFELASRGHHHHFVCLECDGVEDIHFDESDLVRQEVLLAQQNGSSVFRHSLKFFGLCKLCS